MKFNFGLICGLGLFLSCGAMAAEDATVRPLPRELQAISAAYESGQELVTELSSDDIAAPAQYTLNIVVEKGIEALREIHKNKLADQLENEWKNQFSNYLTSEMHDMDLGDHDPLSAWLSKYYQTLFYQTNGMVRQIRVVDDVSVLNYALAVVFHPRGAWRTHTAADRVEYRKHFIPFAHIATYWITDVACVVIMTKLNPAADTSACDNAGQLLEHPMARYLAPKMSDWVFAKANGVNDQLDLTPSDFVFTSEKDFENHVLNNGK